MNKTLKSNMSQEESTDEESFEPEISKPSTIARQELHERWKISVANGDFDNFRIVVNEGAYKDDEYQQGMALYQFCRHGDSRAIRWLLEEKADINFLGEIDETCLVFLYHGHRSPTNTQQLREQLDKEFLEIAQLLINSGVDINAWGSASTSGKGGGGTFRVCTTLHVAAYNFQEPFCRLLINNKADINARQ